MRTTIVDYLHKHKINISRLNSRMSKTSVVIYVTSIYTGVCERNQVEIGKAHGEAFNHFHQCIQRSSDVRARQLF